MTEAPTLDVSFLRYMPVEIDRLRKSRAWLRCRRQPELGFYLMNLWMHAWQQVPAGSIENDDDVLAAAAMCSPDRWDAVRDVVLTGWRQTGNRLCHPTVTELATDAVTKLRQKKNQTEAAREARRKQREAEKPSVTDTVTESETDAVTENDPSVTGSVTEHEGRSKKVEEEEREEPIGSLSETKVSDEPKPPRKRKAYPPEFEAAWLAYPTDANMSKVRAHNAWAKLSAEDRALVAAGIPGFVAYCRKDPNYRPVHMVRFITERRFDGFIAGAGPAAPVDWPKRLAFARDTKTWSTPQWGPMPWQPGCEAPQDQLQPGDGQGWTERARKAA